MALAISTNVLSCRMSVVVRTYLAQRRNCSTGRLLHSQHLRKIVVTIIINAVNSHFNHVAKENLNRKTKHLRPGRAYLARNPIGTETVKAG